MRARCMSTKRNCKWWGSEMDHGSDGSCLRVQGFSEGVVIAAAHACWKQATLRCYTIKELISKLVEEERGAQRTAEGRLKTYNYTSRVTTRKNPGMRHMRPIEAHLYSFKPNAEHIGFAQASGCLGAQPKNRDAYGIRNICLMCFPPVFCVRSSTVAREPGEDLGRSLERKSCSGWQPPFSLMVPQEAM